MKGAQIRDTKLPSSSKSSVKEPFSQPAFTALREEPVVTDTIQLYFCHHCRRTFTGQKVKGKSFPLGMILEGLSLYNTGFTLEESCQQLKEQFGIEVKPSTLLTG